MSKDDKLTVILFALTGFGNPVLKALLKDKRVNLTAVFTIKYSNPFPYYAEQHLLEVCNEQEVNCYCGIKVGSDEGIELLRKHSPDLIIMATFKQILKENVIRIPRLGIVNIHPSLLPRYRGPCPTNAALLNDDEFSGVSIHYVTENLDDGNILLQKSIPINEIINDGQLRQKLSNSAGELIPDLISMFTDFNQPPGIPQDQSYLSNAPRPIVEDGYLEKTKDVELVRCMMRAFNPLPGTSILVGDRRIKVDRFERINGTQNDGVYESDVAVDLIISSQAIRLYKKLE